MHAAQTSYDEGARKRYVRVVQQAFYDEVPSVVLAGLPGLAAYNADLKNWHPNPVAAFDDMLAVDI